MFRYALLFQADMHIVARVMLRASYETSWYYCYWYFVSAKVNLLLKKNIFARVCNIQYMFRKGTKVVDAVILH